MHYLCPVCGYPELDEEPLDYSGEICPSCRFQFGYHDLDSHITFEQWRQQWITQGMIWDKGQSQPPPGWDPRVQLLAVGVKV
jgi:hypothetical protein